MTAVAEKLIRKSPDQFCGDAYLTRSRLPVSTFVKWRRAGITDEDLNRVFGSHYVDDAAAAWDYYLAHSSEIDAELEAENDPVSIQKKPGVCGGDARVRRTRIPVWQLVQARQMGVNDRTMMMSLPSLIESDFPAVWAYYHSHQEEIDRNIFENDPANDELDL